MFFLISVLMSSVSKGRNGTRGCPTATGSSFPALIHLLANTMGMEEAGHSFPPVKNLQAEQTEDQNPQIPMAWHCPSSKATSGWHCDLPAMRTNSPQKMWAGLFLWNNGTATGWCGWKASHLKHPLPSLRNASGTT